MMRQGCADTESLPIGRSSATTRRLMSENARLRGLYEQSKQVASHYELMLREGDHRIKNSLQVVASLMGLQARRATDPVARDALRAATSRIQAVARIHDALQLSGGGKDVVDLGALIEAMCKSLHAMAGDPHAIDIVVNVERIETPLALAQPLVLAVNELVVNALRHAFPDNRSGSITVNVVRVEGEVRVFVADDGAGLPADYLEGRGYGMNLVRTMVAKIGGVLRVEGDAGARFMLSAPAPFPAF